MWEREPLLVEEIKNAWVAGDSVQTLRDVAGNLKTVMSSLTRWSKEKFGTVSAELELWTNSQEMQRMDELLYREELMWMQHSQVAWLKEGDQNTKYFHSKAADRKKKNTITMLRKSDGHITKDRKEMESMATEFFKNLYTADLEVDPGQLTDLFESRITDKMNGDLCKEFTNDEIGTALFQVGPLKASGLDGFQHVSSSEIGSS
jgi:hypothetical protein